MRRAIALVGCVFLLMFDAGAQSTTYEVTNLDGAGTITGIVKWEGPVPPVATYPVTKDAAICDPQSLKRVNLERLLVGPQGGVANTVVFLKNISKGKAMITPDIKPVLDQIRCRYEPHIILVPRGSQLAMKSSDATLHTLHMEGAATYNLPFPYPNQVISRPMPSAGLVIVKCNGGHMWMNAEIFVIDHPYYAITDEGGRFELSDVPPGEYEIVAWHEGWKVVREEGAIDVLTQRRVQRPVFSDPRTWEKNVAVSTRGKSVVDFAISESSK
jgi:hypothetical protein